MKRLVGLLAVTAVFVAGVSWAADGKLGVIRPANPWDKSSDVIYITKEDLTSKNLAQMIQQRFAKLNTTLGIVDTLKHSFSGVSFGATENDTMAAFFRPPAACFVKQVIITWTDWGGQALAAANLSIYKSNYHADTPPDSVDDDGYMGHWDEQGVWHPSSWGVYPLGEWLWGEFPISIDWERVISEGSLTTITEMIWLGWEPDVGRDDFLVVYRPVKGASPHTYLGIQAGNIPVGPEYQEFYGIKLYGGGRAGKPPNSWFLRSYAWNMWLVVEFYENTAPSIADVSDLPSTYSTGPFTVTATINDIDAEDPARAGVAEAYLCYSTDDVSYDSTAMSGPAAGGQFTGQIPAGLPTKTTVYYYVSAKDQPGLYARSPKKSFYLGERTPGVDLIYINEAQRYGTGLASIYSQDMETLGYTFDYIPTPFDETVPLTEYSTWVVDATGVVAPLSELLDANFEGPLKNFLDQGGKLLLIGDEFIGGYYGWPDDSTLAPGDFLKEYFHLAKFHSDAPFETMLDVPGDGFTDELTDTIKFELPAGVPNYHDVMTLDGDPNARPLYIEADDTTFAGGDVAGMLYDGAYKIVFLPFVPAGLPEDTRRAILRDALGFFTGVDQPSTTEVPFTYELHQNYPNPFNPGTAIEYAIPKAGDVELAVYNLLGQKVVTLVDKHQKAGRYRIQWDGTDATGARVASGIYLYKLKAGDLTLTRKMVLMR